MALCKHTAPGQQRWPDAMIGLLGGGLGASRGDWLGPTWWRVAAIPLLLAISWLGLARKRWTLSPLTTTNKGRYRNVANAVHK